MVERFEPTRFQLGGASISNLDRFRKQTGQIAEFFTAQKAEKNVAAALQEVDVFDEEGKPVLEQRGTFKTADRAFNQASLKAYQSAVSNDVLENISRIQDENPNDVEAFQAALDGYKAGLFPEIAELAKPGITQLFDTLETKARINVRGNFITTQETENQKAIDANQAAIKKEITLSSNELKKFIRNGDEEGVLTTLESIRTMATGLDDIAEVAEILETVNKAAFLENESAGVINNIKNNKRLEAATELERLRLSTPPKGISQDEWDAHLDSVTTEVSDLVKIRGDVRKAEQEKFQAENALKLSDLTTLTKDGQVTRDQLEQAFETGVIPTTSKLIQLDQLRQESFKQAEETQKVLRRLDGNNSEVLDATAVNAFYLENVSDLGVAEKALYVDKVKVVPAELRDQVDTQLLSGEPAQVEEAAALIDAIDQVPGIEAPFSNNVRAYADWVVKLSQNMTPQEAIKMATTLTDPRDKNRIEARETEFKDMQKATFGGIDLSVDNLIERGLFNVNIPPSELNKANMQKEYTDQVEALFLSGMNVDGAQKKGAEIVKRNWKDQDFMGKSEAFKYPLADYYAVEGSIDYAENQLSSDVRENMIFANPPTKEEIFLLSDKRTADEANIGSPSYLIYVVQDGQFIQTGQRFRPDVNKGIEARNKRLQALRKRQDPSKRVLEMDFKSL